MLLPPTPSIIHIHYRVNFTSQKYKPLLSLFS
nr:MAG TPA: hypothetical protein [Caudoviricetes sp.]